MSLSFHGSFSYRNDHINIIRIEENVNLRVERENSEVAIIYFANDQGDRIPIPRGITVRNITDNSIVRPSRHGRWFYSISWVPSYEIYRDNVRIVSLDNQKQQVIRGSDDFLYYTTDSDDSRSDGDDNDNGGSDNDDDGSDNDDDSTNDNDGTNDGDMGQLIRDNSNEIDRVITQGNTTLRIGDWVIRSNRPNTRGGSTLLHSNYGDFQVTLIGNHYRFDGFFDDDE
ncbi:hypothetical protein RclHR1_00740013 [Rhizophagus clarus]|uniref:Uncharacterized protein n=1 Tax=Rhizophagus clarus TaxID=94130 RepID=A0A2Z6SC30_9GLOM|nr:hypothetical protein RclHR1_00740013 [Rhizophagus clarus]